MTKLGQHFLTHESTLLEIAKSLRALPRETIVEVGGGHGELTAHLARQFPESRIRVIEKDPELAEFLSKKFGGNSGVNIETGDALKILPKIITPGNNFRIAGNLPYYLTGRFLRIAGEMCPLPEILVLLIQKEVAERIIAVPPRMNRLAASIQVWGKPRIISRVPRAYFRPPPEVEGAVIEIVPYSSRRAILNSYYRTVRVVFAHPRKTVFNNIKTLVKNRAETLDILSGAGLDPNSRPQNLSIPQIKKLSDSL